MSNYPQVKVYLDVPAICWVGNTVFPYNTASIKKEIAELYNIPCLDLYKYAGFNTVNSDYYYVDNVASVDRTLHFNDYGNKIIGEIVAKFIDAC